MIPIRILQAANSGCRLIRMGVQEGGWRLAFPGEQEGRAEGRIHAVIFFKVIQLGHSSGWDEMSEVHTVTTQESSELWKVPITVRLEHIQTGQCPSLSVSLSVVLVQLLLDYAKSLRKCRLLGLLS